MPSLDSAAVNTNPKVFQHIVSDFSPAFLLFTHLDNPLTNLHHAFVFEVK
jgi:hypothetical protein